MAVSWADTEEDMSVDTVNFDLRRKLLRSFRKGMMIVQRPSSRLALEPASDVLEDHGTVFATRSRSGQREVTGDDDDDDDDDVGQDDPMVILWVGLDPVGRLRWCAID